MNCQRCNSQRIILVSAKCSDCCNCEINGHKSTGYVPQDVVFGKGGWGDYVRFKLCLDCGQVQGQFPQPMMKLEQGKDEDE